MASTSTKANASNSNTNSGLRGMTRLQALWEWQETKKKTKQANNERKTTKSDTSKSIELQGKPIPNYMRLTEAAKLRQQSKCRKHETTQSSGVRRPQTTQSSGVRRPQTTQSNGVRRPQTTQSNGVRRPHQMQRERRTQRGNDVRVIHDTTNLSPDPSRPRKKRKADESNESSVQTENKSAENQLVRESIMAVDDGNDEGVKDDVVEFDVVSGDVDLSKEVNEENYYATPSHSLDNGASNKPDELKKSFAPPDAKFTFKKPIESADSIKLEENIIPEESIKLEYSIKTESQLKCNEICSSVERARLLPSADHDVEHFKKLVIDTTAQLENLAVRWDSENTDSLSEDVRGEIRSTACQARLIIAERFTQFSGLISQCEYNTGDRPVLLDDLQGFWEMIYFQVEDVLQKFSNLNKLQANGWEKESPHSNKNTTKRRNVVKKISKKPAKTSGGVSKFAAFKAQLLKAKLVGVTPVKTAEEKTDNDEDVKLAAVNTCGTETTCTTPFKGKETEEEVKTYSLRRSTVYTKIECDSKRLPSYTPSQDHRLAYASYRTGSAKKGQTKRQQSAGRPLLSLSPGVAEYQMTLSNSAIINNEELAASPDLAQYLKNSDSVPRSSPRYPVKRRRSCSPSPSMVRAIISAAHSGKRNQTLTPHKSFPVMTRDAESLHKQVLTRNMTPMANKSLTYTPLEKLAALNLDDSQTDLDRGSQTDLDRGSQTDLDRDSQTDLDRDSKTNPSVVDDLVMVSPLPSTPNTACDLPVITPRRSARLAHKTKRVSLL